MKFRRANTASSGSSTRLKPRGPTRVTRTHTLIELPRLQVVYTIVQPFDCSFSCGCRIGSVCLSLQSRSIICAVHLEFGILLVHVHLFFRYFEGMISPFHLVDGNFLVNDVIYARKFVMRVCINILFLNI